MPNPLPILFLVLCTPFLGYSQSDSVKYSVIQIKSDFGDSGKTYTGAGFIVGILENTLYAVTARHVVKETGLTSIEPPTFEVTFFSRKSISVAATLAYVDPTQDLAIIFLSQT